MNDIFNLVVHVVFLCIGIGAGVAIGMTAAVCKRLASDVTKMIEEQLELRRTKIAARIAEERAKLHRHAEHKPTP